MNTDQIYNLFRSLSSIFSKGNFILILLALIVLCMIMVMPKCSNSNTYVEEEMIRIGIDSTIIADIPKEIKDSINTNNHIIDSLEKFKDSHNDTITYEEALKIIQDILK